MQRGDGSAMISRGQRANDVHAENFAVLLLGDHFDEAFVGPRMEALLLADEREFPIFTAWPASRACRSVRPIEPICGSQ